MYWNHLYNLMFLAFLFSSCHKFCNSSPSTAEHLSSRLPSVLPFCSAQGLSGICFAPLVSSLLSRGTCWMQQHTGLRSFPWCHHHVACCWSSWLNPDFLRFFLLHRALPHTILHPNRQCWCSCAMRPCWGKRTTTLGPSLPCQQQTISLGHETPPLWSQQCWTWQAGGFHSSPLTDSKQQCEWSVSSCYLVGDNKSHL